MKKFFVTLMLLLIFGIPVRLARAAPAITPSPTPILDLYQITDCEIDPSDPTASHICHVRYDIVNSVLRPSQDAVEHSNKPLVGLEKWANMVWGGIVKPAKNNYMLGTIFSEPYGNQVENASFQDLTPAGLQDITVHNTSPMLYSVTSRLCVADPTNPGRLAGDFITEQIWQTKDNIPGAVAQTDGTQRLASYTTRYVNPSQNFTKNNVLVKKIIPPPCGESATGDPVDQAVLTTINENRFTDQNTPTSIKYTITEDMQKEEDQTVTDPITRLVSHIITFISKFIVPAKHVAGGKVPYEAQNYCNGAGCPNPGDLDPAAELTTAQKKGLQSGGGWINSMYRPDAIDPNYTVGLNAKYIGQQWEALFTKVNTADTTVYAMRRTEEAQTYANCALLPAGQQSTYYSGGECDKSWVSSSTTLADSSIPSLGANDPGTRNSKDGKQGPLQCTNKKPIGAGSGKSANLSTAIAGAAAWAGIPGCVLSGVADIEGASEEMAQGSCVPNQCGAAGPFQVSVGVDSCGNKTCDSCGSGWGGRACNDESWALKLAGGSAASACDVGVAAKAAAAVVMGKAKGFKVPFAAGQTTFDPNNAQQKKTIITAADAYYGVPTSIPRLGNLSYGEYVYQTCLKSQNSSATYSHRDHRFP